MIAVKPACRTCAETKLELASPFFANAPLVQREIAGTLEQLPAVQADPDE